MNIFQLLDTGIYIKSTNILISYKIFHIKFIVLRVYIIMLSTIHDFTNDTDEVEGNAFYLQTITRNCILYHI